MATIYTLGHSTRSLEDLTAALHAHGIKCLVDIRSYPISRRMPHFRGPLLIPGLEGVAPETEPLEITLPRAGIEYRWARALGGRRKRILKESPNTGLRVQAFRNYADYMMTPEFQRAAGELVQWAEQQPTAIMCAERVWFHCHRMLVSDWLVAQGHEVLHIDDAGPVKAHKLTAEAQVVEGGVVYRGLF